MASAGSFWLREVLPFAAMVFVECTTVGISVLFKAASLEGLSYYVFVAYFYALSTLVLSPLAFFFRSSAVLPSSKVPLISRICFLGVIGFLAQICGYKGLDYTSPTVSSAMSTLVPAFTFILAIILRMEKLALRTPSTQAKIIGTIVTILGALVIVLYKGPAVVSAASTVLLHWPLGSSESNWIIGSLLLVAEYLLLAIWYIVQTNVMKIYPAEITVVFFYNLCALVISVPVCFIAESDLSSWRLGTTISVVAVIYSGFFGSCINTIIHSWGLRIKGSVYVVIFRPLSIAIAAFMSTIFLGEALYLGSIIGAIILFIGFYGVIWGKAKEEVEEETMDDLSHDQVPLLQKL